MKERRTVSEKHGVIFALWDGMKIQLEGRTMPGIKFYGYTIVPGGAVEISETLEEALSREVREEYGVEVLEYKKLGFIPKRRQCTFAYTR